MNRFHIESRMLKLITDHPIKVKEDDVNHRLVGFSEAAARYYQHPTISTLLSLIIP